MAAQRALHLAAGNGAGPPVLGVIVLPIAPLVVAGVVMVKVQLGSVNSLTALMSSLPGTVT